MAAADDCPRQAVADYPELKVKAAIIKTLFGQKLEEKHEDEWDEFFEFYHDETKTMHGGSLPARVVKYSRKHVPTHREVRDVLDGISGLDLRKKRSELREKLKEVIASIDAKNNVQNVPSNGQNGAQNGTQNTLAPSPDSAPEDHILDCAMRILLMVNINKQRDNDTETVSWKDDSMLSELLERVIPRAAYGYVTNKGGRIHPYFTAAFMARICDLDIQLTDSLEDHLRLQQRGTKRTLRIFGHKKWLMQHLEMYKSNPSFDLRLPSGLVKETVFTLELLFPYEDPDTRSFCDSRGWHFHRLGAMKRLLNLNDFDYWRGRLVEIHEDVFQAPPATWKQLFYDRRNPQQFWTFWIALIILGLTVVSTVSTILQTVYAIAAFYKSS